MDGEAQRGAASVALAKRKVRWQDWEWLRVFQSFGIVIIFSYVPKKCL